MVVAFSQQLSVVPNHNQTKQNALFCPMSLIKVKNLHSSANIALGSSGGRLLKAAFKLTSVHQTKTWTRLNREQC